MKRQVHKLDGVNATTRKYPRTLLEAFPTHYHHYIEAPEERIGLWDIVLSLLSIVLMCVVVYLFARS